MEVGRAEGDEGGRDNKAVGKSLTLPAPLVPERARALNGAGKSGNAVEDDLRLGLLRVF